MSPLEEVSYAATGAEYAVGSPAPPPNDGNSANTWHWRAVDQIAGQLRRAGFRDIRVDQQQVRDGVIVGENRPDIQATDRRGRRVIVEVDTDRDESRRHQDVVTRLDPRATSVFVRLDPNTGRMTNRVIASPQTQGGSALRRGAFRLTDVIPEIFGRRLIWRRTRPVPVRQREAESLLQVFP